MFTIDLMFRLFKRSITETAVSKSLNLRISGFPWWVILRKQMFFKSTSRALMKLFTINGVGIKAFAKLKMAWNAVLLNTG